MAGVADAQNTVATWLMSVLGGDATLAALVNDVVEELQVDRAQAYPFVVFTHMAGLSDTRIVGMAPVMANLLYEIRVVDRGASFQAAAAAYSRVNQLIDRTGYTLVNTNLGQGQIIACFRQNPVQYVEGVGAIDYRSVGGLYQFAVN